MTFLRELAALAELIMVVLTVWAAIIGGGLLAFWLIGLLGGAPA